MSFSTEKKLSRIFRVPHFRGVVAENAYPWELDLEYQQTEFFGIVGNSPFQIRTKTNFQYLEDPREILAIGPDDENGFYPVIHATFSADGDLSSFREYMGQQGKRTPNNLGHWDLSQHTTYLNAVTITNKLVDDVYELIKKSPHAQLADKRIHPTCSRREKLQWLSGQPSLPRQVKAGNNPDIKQSNFYGYIGGGSYTAEVDISVFDPQTPYKLNLIGAGEEGTFMIEICFKTDGSVASLKEEVHSAFEDNMFKKEIHIMPHNLEFYQDLADKIADRAVNDIIFRSQAITRSATRNCSL